MKRRVVPLQMVKCSCGICFMFRDGGGAEFCFLECADCMGMVLG
jgi:hypothetical protein